MKEHISEAEMISLLEDIRDKLQHEKKEECCKLIEQIVNQTEAEKSIDRAYVNEVITRKRKNRIDEIDQVLKKMSDEQIHNVHQYTMAEYDEPNHEAEALQAVIKLSRKTKETDTDVKK